MTEKHEVFDVYVPAYGVTVKASEGDTTDMINFRAYVESHKDPDFAQKWEASKKREGTGESITKGIYRTPVRFGKAAWTGTKELGGNLIMTGQRVAGMGRMAWNGLQSLVSNQDEDIKKSYEWLKEISKISGAMGEAFDEERKETAENWGGDNNFYSFVEGVGSIVPSLASSMVGIGLVGKGATLTTKAKAGITAIQALYGGGALNEVARDLEAKGISAGKAFLTAVPAAFAVGKANALGDKLPLQTLLTKGGARLGMDKIIAKMFLNGLGEAAEETAEYSVRKATEFLHGVNEQQFGEITMDVLTTAVMSFAVGGFVEGATIGYKGLEGIAAKKELKKDLIGAGFSPEQAEVKMLDMEKAVSSESFQKDMAGLNQVLSSPEFKELQQQTLSEQRQTLIKGLNDVLLQSEAIDMQIPSIENPEAVPPELPESYVLDGEQVNTADNPALAMMLYQSEQEGNPIQTISDALKLVDDKVGVSDTVKTAAGLSSVFAKAKDNLTASGFDAEEIEPLARVQTAMAYSLGKAFGMTPEQAYGTFPNIRNTSFSEAKDIAPLGKEVDAFMLLKNPTLYGKLKEIEDRKRGRSLLGFIKNAGGLKDVGGDLKAMDAGKSYIGLINNKSGQSLDDMALSAWEAGYFPQHTERPEINDLLNAIREELFGNKIYSEHDQFVSLIDEADKLDEALESYGIDYQNMTAEEARQALNEAYDAEYPAATYELPQDVVDELNYNQDFDDGIPFQSEQAALFQSEQIAKEVQSKMNSKESKENVVKSKKAFSKAMDELSRGELKSKTLPIVLQHPSEVWKMVGLPDRKISFSTKKIRTIMDKHGLTIDDFKALPEKLADPEFIFESKTDDTAFVGVLSTTGEPLVAVVKPVGKELRITNVIKSFYNKDRGFVERETKAGRLLYDKKNPTRFRRHRALIAQVFPSSDDSIIQQSKGDVNTLYQSAFHGTPHAELEGGHFSLEKIGTGENAQSHGYGLYYTSKFDIADSRYRKRLLGPYQNFISIGQPVYDTKTGKYKNAFNYDSIEFEVYSDYKLLAEEDYDVLIKSYKQLEGIDKSIKEKIAIAEKYKDKFKDVKSFVDESAAKGQVYEVDLPEMPLLLDEQKTFENQSDFVQDVLNRISKEYGIQVKGKVQAGVNFHDITGKYIYSKLAGQLGSAQKASEKLREYGIKGITYDGKQDGRCFVIFNPDDVKVIQKFYQNASDPYGAYDRAQNIIYLFEKANRSTFLHEMSHFYMDQMLRAAENGSQAAVEMKKSLDKWLHKREGDVYTRADWERFSVGFEQYLREGKAPNSYLKQAFDTFKQWLENIYGALKATKLGITNEVGSNETIRMNDEIRSLYNDMLGGQDIDAIFEKADTIRKAEQALKIANEQAEAKAQETAAFIEDIAKSAPEELGRIQQYKEKLKQYKKEFSLEDIYKSLTSVAKEIDPAFALKMREYAKNESDIVNHYAKQVAPFIQKLQSMSAKDKSVFDIYAKNGHLSGIERLATKYGFEQEYQTYRAAMDEIYQHASSLGIKMNYREVYFPRRVKNKTDFLEYIGSKDAGLISQMNAELGINATESEKVEWLNGHINTFSAEHIAGLPGNTKNRTIEVIDNELNKFYELTVDAIAGYIDSMSRAINIRQVWGRSVETDDGNLTEIGLKQTIGDVIAKGMEKGTITTNAQMKKVRKILTAYLGEHGQQWKWLSVLKNTSLANLLTRGTATLSQIGDIGMNTWNNGLVNTITSLVPDAKVDIKMLGIDKLTEEFRHPEVFAKEIETLYKLSLFDKADIYMKNTFLSARWKALKGISETELENYLRPMFEERTDALVKDIKADRVTEDVKLLLYSELCEVQPMSKAELPYAYSMNPNGRIIYMLKTFALRRLNFILDRTAGEWKKGNKTRAIKNLVTLAVVLGGFDALAGLIKDLVRGKEPDITENTIDGVLGLFMINRYSLYKLRTGGMGEFLSAMLIPPVVPVTQSFLMDLQKVIKGKKEVKDMEFISYLTFVGNAYYWYFGGGVDKKKREQKRKRKE